MSKSTILSVIIFVNAMTVSAYAGSQLGPNEPAFCDYKTFQKLEVQLPTEGLVRSHGFKLGQLLLVGLGVGKSDVAATRSLANQFAKTSAQEKSCTWYFNDGSDQAAEAFHHFYVTSPIFKSEKVAEKYEALNTIFQDNEVSLLSCAVDHGYIAMGCDGMKHRGPSVFAMLLAYAGCSPKNATKIANKVWGNNFVSTSTREAIAVKGFALGEKNPHNRILLQTLMTAK